MVTVKSLDPSILRIDGVAQRSTAVGPGQSAEVRFTASALGIGKARVQMTARLNGESDAYEDVLPVEVLVSPETVAAYGPDRYHSIGNPGASGGHRSRFPAT
jgi:hypothetical protein